MGCDIHPHFEIKLKGVWHHYSQPRIERDYLLFALLANVRETPRITPIAMPRGLPDDISDVTRMLSTRDRYYRSHSWLTMPEFALAAEFVEASMAAATGQVGWSWSHQRLGYLCGNDIWQWTPGDAQYYAANIEDVRIVFWFDN